MADAKAFIEAHPGLREAMIGSTAFRRLKDSKSLVIGGRTYYVVRGDALGTEEELYVEALLRGAGSDRHREPYRTLYLELTDDLRHLVQDRSEAEPTREEDDA